MVPESESDRLGRIKRFGILPPGTIISHYKIVEKIGEGGMGVVYKAIDTKLDRTVALKFLPARLVCDTEARGRFEQEAKAASALSHANITTVYEIDEADGMCFMGMEHIEGRSLKAIISEETLSIDDIVNIGLQIASGLDAAHKKGVVHRDIKSDNIMVTEDGVVKIMDFGLAKLRGASRLTEVGTTVGTLSYMSPEQIQGKKLDHRSDIFSFGVVLYEMITGRLPFGGDYAQSIAYSILNETPDPLARYKADVPDGLQRIVDKTLAKASDERYQHVDEIAADLRREKRASEQVVAAPAVAGWKRGKRLLRVAVPAAAACVVILLLLVFEPFSIRMGPREEAAAQDNSLAIMYFENLADPEDADKTAQMITALLITDLSESRYIRVVGRQRLYDILRLLGKEDSKVIDKTVASEVAREAKVKWILTGSILQAEPHMVLTADISEAATGEILATQRVSGEKKEDLFSVVDRLSAQIRTDLSVPADVGQRDDRPVAFVTTHSPEAYRHYLDGLDHLNSYNLREAEISFRKAIGFDSTFAMAYYRLAGVEWLQAGPMQEQLIAQSVKYSDRVTEKERYYIHALAARFSQDYATAIKHLDNLLERFPDEKEALYEIGVILASDLMQDEEAIRYLSRAVEIDPLHGLAYNVLAYAYCRTGDFENAIWAINKYTSLHPGQANPYDSRGDIYALCGKIDQAIDSYRRALEVKPDFHMSRAKLGHMYLFKQQYAEAEGCYRKLCDSGDRDLRSRGRYCLALIPIRQGRFREALAMLDDGIGADRMERAQGPYTALKYMMIAKVLREQGDLAGALQQTETGLTIWQKVIRGWDRHYWLGFYAGLLVESGQDARAEQAVKALESEAAPQERGHLLNYWLAMGSMERARDNPEAAITYLEKAAEVANPDMFSVWIALASAYLEAGRLGEAVEQYEGLLTRYSEFRLDLPVCSVKCHYQLGLAYEKSGWDTKAVEQYGEFVDIWKNADPGIPEIADARQRLARLRKPS
jgi:tetratricopeptide (TPR) repeat protein/predicted Ser/Thr protein kinase